MMHAKIAVIDGLWTSIGNYNRDNVSLLYNLEVALEVLDPELGGGRHGSAVRERCRALQAALDRHLGEALAHREGRRLVVL